MASGLEATNRTINQLTNETKAENWFENNQGLVISIVIILLLSVFGFGGYSIYKDKQNAKKAQLIHAFRQTELKDWTDKKITDDIYFQKLMSLSKTLENFSGSIPIMLDSSDRFVENKNYTMAMKLLEHVNLKYENITYASYFILARLASVYEDIGQIDKSINILNKITNSKFKILQAKAYLDLGRLYLKKGNASKANASFEYILNTWPNDSLAKLAKLYLAKIAGK